MIMTPYGPQGEILAHRLGMTGMLVILVAIVCVMVAVGTLGSKHAQGVTGWMKGTALVGLGAIVALLPLIIVNIQSSTEQFYEVKPTAVKAIGPVVKPDVLSFSDGSARQVVYEDHGHQYKQLVKTDNIKLSDYGDAAKSLKEVRRGTIKAKIELKPRYRRYGKQIKREFKPDRKQLVNVDDTTVHLDRPSQWHRLDQAKER